MKYIIMSVVKPGKTLSLEIPFVFPDLIVHKHMADSVVPLLGLHFGTDAIITPVSAGFVSSTAFEDDCYGRSESLELSSRLGDSQLLKMCDYGSMYV